MIDTQAVKRASIAMNIVRSIRDVVSKSPTNVADFIWYCFQDVDGDWYRVRGWVYADRIEIEYTECDIPEFWAACNVLLENGYKQKKTDAPWTVLLQEVTSE